MPSSVAPLPALASSIELIAIWSALWTESKAPKRQDFTPRRMAKFLPDIFILHQEHHKNDLVFRLAGTRLCAIHRRELRSESFKDLWQDADRDTVQVLMQSARADIEPYIIDIMATSKAQRTAECQLVLLPLETGWIGAFFAKDKPYWLQNDPVIKYSLLNALPISGLQPRKSAVNHSTGIQASTKTKKPRLRVISGGKSCL